MQKVLITGINGFIGAAVAEGFSAAGAAVYGIDRVERSSPYTTFALDLLRDSTVDILREVQPDIVVYCAGCADVNFSVTYPIEDFQGNVFSFHRFLFDMKACALMDTRVIFLSSAAVYGQPVELPVRETAPLAPISPYALHKRMAEEICLYFNRNYTFHIVIARIFSAYGPGLHKQLFWDMAQKLKATGRLELFGNGNETRDFIYKEDLVQAIMLLATDRAPNYEIYNVANGTEISIKETAKIFLKYFGQGEDKVLFTQAVREGNPNNWCADISRLKELGYVQNVFIEQGIHNYVRWVSGTS
ncbi:MAG: NAD-dependent epimerase/dehydratase family protein [Clostridium sp.]|nr:NAD-dependent epimerase/dehydratase family protein [Clostridium sp.]